MAGVRITQEVPGTLPGQRYGNFAGKPAGTTTHPVARVTKFGPWGVSQKLYGSFAGRSVARVTQLGLWGVPQDLYGSFAGKPETSAEGGGPYIPTYRPRRR